MASMVVGLGLLFFVAEPRVYDPGPVSMAQADSGAAHEVFRIRRHLAHVESTLRDQTPPGLTEAQRAAREELMDILHAYWVAGEFPRNRDHADRRVPYFIDADGTPCAVGHLMIESGAATMAREIATYENFDFVSEIDHPGVGPWLEQHGLTAEEAGWIQPSYGPCGFSYETVCGSDGNNYACEAVAVQCAGVEVVSVGPCGAAGDTSTSSTSTGSAGSSGSTTDGSTSGGSSGETGSPDAPIIGEEICPAGTGTGTGGGFETTGGEDPTATSSSTSSPEPTGSGGQGTDAPAQDEPSEDPSGCRTGGGGGAPGMLAFGLLALLGLRRRR